MDRLNRSLKGKGGSLSDILEKESYQGEIERSDTACCDGLGEGLTSTHH